MRAQVAATGHSAENNTEIETSAFVPLRSFDDNIDEHLDNIHDIAIQEQITRVYAETVKLQEMTKEYGFIPNIIEQRLQEYQLKEQQKQQMHDHYKNELHMTIDDLEYDYEKLFMYHIKCIVLDNEDDERKLCGLGRELVEILLKRVGESNTYCNRNNIFEEYETECHYDNEEQYKTHIEFIRSGFRRNTRKHAMKMIKELENIVKEYEDPWENLVEFVKIMND